MFTKLITAVFGSKHGRDVKRIMPLVGQINQLSENYQGLADDALQHKTDEFKERLAGGATLDDLLPEAYAAVKETCRRFLGRTWEVCEQPTTWDMVPYNVQLVGAVVLHQGRIAEMATGEGKTLAATMPIYLNALTGRGVHLVTFNDFLARRDTAWMGPIYDFLGLTVSVIQDKADYLSGRPHSHLLVQDGDRYELEGITRKEAYQADVVYGRHAEFGFDYLRDNMEADPDELVQRGYQYAIVDEVDSILIDEARTPHIMSGPVPESSHRYDEMKPKVEQLVRKQTGLVNGLVAEGTRLLEEGQEYEAGIKLLQSQRGAPENKRLLKVLQEEGVKRLINRVEGDFMRDKRLHEVDEELYYSIDEKSHVVDLMEQGRALLSPQDQDMFVLPDLSERLQEMEEDPAPSAEERAKREDALYEDYALKNERVHNVHQLLKAYSLFEKDVDYVVSDGKVIIVDEATGRLQPGRRYSEGLHQALEAKENVRIEQETQTMATITLQNYFRLYEKLAGMTGTAETEAQEFYKIYKVDTAVIPTNEPVRRIDYDDNIYRSRREKYNAIISEIERFHEASLPVLVGTASVEVSEVLSRMLKRKGIRHSLLNAKYHQKEAEIVATAGQPGGVTIATNMAGRGTDIKLGPGVVKATEGHQCALLYNREDPRPRCPHIDEYDCRNEVPCGLQIIGSERHEARRIDRQLRGRSGRQGDPGASRFFLSLEDDLMRLFGSARIAGVMDRLGVEEGEVIRHSMVTKAIERAQKRVEERNFEIRKHLLEYDDVMSQQRDIIYGLRRQALTEPDVREQIEEMMRNAVEAIVETRADPDLPPEEWDLVGLNADLRNTFLIDFSGERDRVAARSPSELTDWLSDRVRKNYARREEMIGADRLKEFEKSVLLAVIDDKWKDHLREIDDMKEGIGLRAYGGKDPLIEYKNEAFSMFEQIISEMDRETLKILFRASSVEEREMGERARRAPAEVRAHHQEATGMGFAELPEREETALAQAGQGPQEKREPVRVEKIGRNAPCPCGSGKKYKKCCGANR